MKKIRFLILIIWFGFFTPFPVQAALTQVLGPDQAVGAYLTGPGGTLDTLYGWDNLQRIDDFNAVSTDQYWSLTDHELAAEATLRAKFAGYTHEFGLLPSSEGSSFKKLFNTGGSAYVIYGQDQVLDIPKPKSFTLKKTGDSFRFALKIKNIPGLQWSSVQNENLVMPNGSLGDGMDHMVTFMIAESDELHNNAIGNYVVAWEDLNANGNSSFDGDYGDLVVELSNITPFQNGNIPEPSSIIFFSLSGLILIKKFVSKKHSKKR